MLCIFSLLDLRKNKLRRQTSGVVTCRAESNVCVVLLHVYWLGTPTPPLLQTRGKQMPLIANNNIAC